MNSQLKTLVYLGDGEAHRVRDMADHIEPRVLAKLRYSRIVVARTLHEASLALGKQPGRYDLVCGSEAHEGHEDAATGRKVSTLPFIQDLGGHDVNVILRSASPSDFEKFSRAHPRIGFIGYDERHHLGMEAFQEGLLEKVSLAGIRLDMRRSISAWMFR